MRKAGNANEFDHNCTFRDRWSRGFLAVRFGELPGWLGGEPVVLKREKGNVTIFAFDEGQGLSEHTSPFDALVQAVEGEAEITVSGKPIAVKTGDIVLLPADKPHAVKANTRFKMVLTMIRS